MPLPNAWRLTLRQNEAARSPVLTEPLDPPTDEASEEPTDEASEEPTGAGQAQLINVNEAVKSDLVSLPGIGPASADAIIRNRPYESVEEMIQKASLTRLDANDVAIITNSITF